MAATNTTNSQGRLQTSFLFQNCDFIANYAGCGEILPSFLTVNLVFMIIFLVCGCMLLFYLLERIHNWRRRRTSSSGGGGGGYVFWQWPVIQAALLLSTFLVQVGGLASVRSIQDTPNLDDASISYITCRTILLECAFVMLANLSIFRYSQFIMQNIGRFKESERESVLSTSKPRKYYWTKQKLIFAYQITHQLLMIVLFILWATIGVDVDLNTFIVCRTVVCSVSLFNHAIAEPWIVYTFGTATIKDLLKQKDMKEKGKSQLRSKIQRIKNEILQLYLTNHVPCQVTYLLIMLGNLYLQNQKGDLLICKIIQRVGESLGPIAVSISFFSRALHSLMRGREVSSSSRTVASPPPSHLASSVEGGPPLLSPPPGAFTATIKVERVH